MILCISVLLLAATGVTSVILGKYIIAQEISKQRQAGQNLLALIEPLVVLTSASDNATTLSAKLGQITADPAIASLRITGGNGQVLFQHQGEAVGANWLVQKLSSEDMPASLATQFPLTTGGHARVDLGYSFRDINRNIHELAISIGIFALVLLVASIAFTFLLLKRFTAPLKPIIEIITQFSRGNWAPKVRLLNSGTREIQKLNQALVQGSVNMRDYIHNLDSTRSSLQHNESRLRTLINSMHEILFELDQNGRFTFLNPAWQQLTGFSIDEVMGRPFTEFLIDQKIIVDFDPEFLGELHEKNREIHLRTADGRGLWVSMDADAHYDPGDRFTGVIGTLSDVTQSVELNTLLSKYQDDLYELSVTDPLTGLYNRRHFDAQLDLILSDLLPLGQSVCLLIIDLDGFKFINDTYGHPMGDEALRTISKLLQEMASKGDYLARLAGDEFAMVLKNTTLQTATQIAAKLHSSINESHINLPVGHIQLQCSIGVAEAPLHGHNVQELVSAADVALYQSKRRGRNRIEVLSPDTSETVMSVFHQGFQLRNALEQGNVMPAFQPICDMRTGQPVAYEALARMRLNNVTVLAADFIGVAEELGLTREIDLHIIEQSLHLAPEGYDLFLNLDPTSFNDRNFANDLHDLLAPACRAGRAITIEITERENVVITDLLLSDIQSLRKLGCKLALDDFGSGYSTYNFLNLFRPEYLKIEGAFVRGMLDNESDRKIVEHIHDLAVSFGISTIAESVENERTRQALLSIGIFNAQGMHLGTPEMRQAS